MVFLNLFCAHLGATTSINECQYPPNLDFLGFLEHLSSITSVYYNPHTYLEPSTMRFYSFSILCFLFATTSALSNSIRFGDVNDENSISSQLAGIRFNYRRDSPGYARDIQCDIRDNSLSTSAVLALARELTGEFEDSIDLALQRNMIQKCCYVTGSDI